MNKFEVLKQIYNKMDDGYGILDYSLEGDGLKVLTEDGKIFNVVVEEIEEEE